MKSEDIRDTIYGVLTAVVICFVAFTVGQCTVKQTELSAKYTRVHSTEQTVTSMPASR